MPSTSRNNQRMARTYLRNGQCKSGRKSPLRDSASDTKSCNLSFAALLFGPFPRRRARSHCGNVLANHVGTSKLASTCTNRHSPTSESTPLKPPDRQATAAPRTVRFWRRLPQLYGPTLRRCAFSATEQGAKCWRRRPAARSDSVLLESDAVPDRPNACHRLSKGAHNSCGSVSPRTRFTGRSFTTLLTDALPRNALLIVPSNGARLLLFPANWHCAQGQNGHEKRQSDDANDRGTGETPTTQRTTLRSTRRPNCSGTVAVTHNFPWQIRTVTQALTTETRRAPFLHSTFHVLKIMVRAYETGAAHTGQPQLWTGHSTRAPASASTTTILPRAVADGHARRTLQLTQSHKFLPPQRAKEARRGCRPGLARACTSLLRGSLVLNRQTCPAQLYGSTSLPSC